jgi:hypothetical protein
VFFEQLRRPQLHQSICMPGKVESSLLEQLMKKPEHRAWAEQAQSAASNPDGADLEDGRNFAKEVMEKAL